MEWISGVFSVFQNLDEMIGYYYSFRGWDKQGIPTEEKLKELAICEGA